jgi:hypothetical protein
MRERPLTILLIIVSATTDSTQGIATSEFRKLRLSLDPGRHLASLDMAVLLSLHSSWISRNTAS